MQKRHAEETCRIDMHKRHVEETCRIDMIIRKRLRQREVAWLTTDGNGEGSATSNIPRSSHSLGQAAAIKSHRNTRKDKLHEPVIAKLNTRVSSKSP